MNNEGSCAVQHLAPNPAIFLAFQFQDWPEQHSDVFAELDAWGIERLVRGALQCDRAQHAIVFGQRDGADRVLTMFARQRLMGAHDMLMAIRIWNNDD